jgi:hypothetical protein
MSKATELRDSCDRHIREAQQRVAELKEASMQSPAIVSDEDVELAEEALRHWQEHLEAVLRHPDLRSRTDRKT